MSQKIQVVVQGQILELSPNEFPVVFYYKEKIYYVKYTPNKDSLYLNNVELSEDKHSERKKL